MVQQTCSKLCWVDIDQPNIKIHFGFQKNYIPK